MAFPKVARLRLELGERVRLSVSGNDVILYVALPRPAGNSAHGARNLAEARTEAHPAEMAERYGGS
jgi:hypothetical protein